MKKIRLKKIDLFKFDNLSEFKSITHFVTGRRNSNSHSFSLSLSSDKNIENIINNRKTLAKALNIPIENFVFQQQEHTKNISIITSEYISQNIHSKQHRIMNNDGMVSHEKGICLMVMGADCVPILFYDPVKEVIGAAHAGWRGTVQGIAMEIVIYMKLHFGCNPEDIFAGIGPSIGPQNYEVDLPVYSAFNETFPYANELFVTGKKPGKFMLNLWKANQMQLLSVGLKAENIEISNLCTFENNAMFFSARKGDSGRFAGGIMLC